MVKVYARWIRGTYVWRPVSRSFREPEQVVRVRPDVCIWEDLERLHRCELRPYGMTKGRELRALDCGKRRVDVAQLGLMRDVDGHVVVLFTVGRVRKAVGNGGDAKTRRTYISCETLGRMLPSRLRYSVFRSHGTCGTDDIGVDVPDEGPAPRTGPADAGSPSRNWSLGSSLGRLLGSGFSSSLTEFRYIAQQRQRSKFDAHEIRTTHLNHHHSLPTDSPTATSRAASPALHLRPLAEALKTRYHLGTRVAHIAWGR